VVTRRKTRRARPVRRSSGSRRALPFAIAAIAIVAGALWLPPRRLPAPPLAPPRVIEPGARVAAVAGRAAAASGAVAAAPTAASRHGGVSVPGRSRTPRVAIVIDDLGDNLDTAARVLALEPGVTVAVIPFRAASSAVAAAAVARGREVILHLPLEPERDAAMRGGRGFLRTSMDVGDLESQLERDLRAVPYIIGVNGHMGSRFTADPRAMRMLLGALRERGLFFLDSKTSPESVAAEVAEGLDVPFAERSVFLDHDPDPAAVARALGEVAARARAVGEAIAIGHPYPSTMAALAKWLPSADAQGIEVVPLSALVR
jgi:uncharacterized protein